MRSWESRTRKLCLKRESREDGCVLEDMKYSLVVYAKVYVPPVRLVRVIKIRANSEERRFLGNHSRKMSRRSLFDAIVRETFGKIETKANKTGVRKKDAIIVTLEIDSDIIV